MQINFIYIVNRIGIKRNAAHEIHQQIENRFLSGAQIIVMYGRFSFAEIYCRRPAVAGRNKFNETQFCAVFIAEDILQGGVDLMDILFPDLLARLIGLKDVSVYHLRNSFHVIFKTIISFYGEFGSVAVIFKTNSSALSQ